MDPKTPNTRAWTASGHGTGRGAGRGAGRGVGVDEAARQRIITCGDSSVLSAWIARAATMDSIGEILAEPAT